MSNHLVSQPLPISGTQAGQLEHIPTTLEPSMPMMQMGLMGLVPGNPGPQQHSAPKQQMGFTVPMSTKGFEVQKLSTLGNYEGQDQSRDKVLGSQQYMVSPRQLEMANMLKNQGTPHLSLLNKRKAPMEPPGALKRTAQPEHRPWLLQQPVAGRKVMPNQSMQQALGGKQLPAQTKRLTHMDSISPKSATQRAVTPRTQTSGPSLAKGETFDSVRSKMRESLAGALALVSHEHNKAATSVKNSQDEASIRGTQSSASDITIAGSVSRPSEEPKEELPCSEGSHDLKVISGQASATVSDGSPAMVSAPNIEDFESDNLLSTDDVPFSDHFFVKDDLLQGNGLSWVLESDMGVEETNVSQPIQVENPVHEHVEEKRVVTLSPEELSIKIEGELYKLFGGVNKKYKERARSLLFNLKDRNNPELRERVVAGEIPAERLCAMTAEELASKELSEWRMAKAEELAQMVVLPDSEVDMRRLVKKTHKGEVQVEVEEDNGVSEEVSLGSSTISRNRIRPKEKESPRKPNEIKEGNARGGKTGVVEKAGDYTLTIPTEDQESEVDIMVDDAIGDLPPIVSLDEFMESLDTEPPFVDLQAETGKTESRSPEKDLLVGSALKSPERSPRVADNVPEKAGKVDDTLLTSDIDVKSSESQGKSEGRLSPVISKDEQVWEGHLQLNISTTVSVLGGFKSGERTHAKEWSSVVEIKGRVKLDAFEKFLQDLRMSRSRAIMVVHFLCKDGASENERASICEAADSYVLEKRVGFGVPSQGVELYFCPPHSRTREILGKVLPEDQIHALDSVDSGLIGVVIWRRTQFTSSGAIKQHSASKKQHVTSSSPKSRHHQDKFDRNVSSPRYPPSRLSHGARTPSSYNVNDVRADDDDDVPPGFGPAPGASRDIDDLPEFNFSGGGADPRAGQNLHPSQVPARPVDQIRELIHMYGKPRGEPAVGNVGGVPVQPWNDDDDDIPEWQPQGLGQSINSRADVRDGHQQYVYPSTGQVSRSSMQEPASWSSSHARGGQSYGQPRGRAAGWRQDGHRSRRGY